MSPKLRNSLLIGRVVLASAIVCSVAVLLASCQAIGGFGARAPEYSYDVEAETRAVPPYPTMAPMAPEAVGGVYNEEVASVSMGQQTERLIVRTGSISMVVEDTRAAQAEIEQMVNSMADQGAFIVSSNEYGGAPDGSPYISMSIRVPAERFDEVMDRLKAMAVQGTSPTVSASAQDVTEEYVDLEARVQSLEAARDRLLELMRGAQTTEDLLMAEQQLTQREAEIEALKGRMRYLAETARLSQISIDLQPYILSQPVDTRWRPAETVRRAFEALVNGARNFGDFLIYFSIAVLPWLLLVALVIYGVVRFIAWRVRIGRARRAAQAASSQATE